eukprot:CAMPEP_0183342596 /NCGR_PEP_ID=MMETSP0164_2-20130417/8685_2 /TAXON_ID=221442 /ORGANISM="Coccolithus pelagicus ssp braarudi, Strain PLY182g" /LENGTH=112 /DNA_ID=CAMNT_0025513233 /DNA_START=140 /DNA_END=476 /DNA_ORIENTATION=-
MGVEVAIEFASFTAYMFAVVLSRMHHHRVSMHHNLTRCLNARLQGFVVWDAALWHLQACPHEEKQPSTIDSAAPVVGVVQKVNMLLLGAERRAVAPVEPGRSAARVLGAEAG